MKNFNKFLGVIAIVVVIGFTLAGCGDKSDPNIPGGNISTVIFSIVTANGSSSQSTTQLTLTFSQAITGLSANDITLSGVSGVNKGTLSGSGPTYTLPISGFTSGGTLSVAVAKWGYNIIGSPKTVTIYYSTGGDNPGGGGTTPDAPTGVTATAQSSSSISVSWNSVSDATSYKIYYEIGISTTKNLAGTVTGTSYTHTGLQANTTYYYYIKAANSTGESDYSSYGRATTQSSSLGGGTTVPSAPTGVTATAQSTSSISVSWNSVSDATGYYIYRSSSSSGTYSQVGTSSSTSYTNTGLSASTTYYYKVAAYNSSGTGPQSSYDYATTQAAVARETRLDQPTFGTCSISGSNAIFNWTLKTTGTTPNGSYDYVAPTSIKIEVYAEGTTWYTLTSTLSGTARTYTLNNWETWSYIVGGVSQRVSLRVTCIRSGNTETSAMMSYWKSTSGSTGSWVPTY